MLSRRGVVVSLLAFGGLGAGMASPSSPPTFIGYHWPTHTSAKYQLHWQVEERYPRASTSTTSTTSWNPDVTIRTGSITREGLSVSMDIEPAQYATTEVGDVTVPPAMTLDAMSVQAVLTSQGSWKDVHWSLPAKAILPRSVLAAMLPLQDFLPLVPAGGWTAGQPTEVSYTASALDIASFHVETKRSVDMEVKITPSVGNVHWTVRSTLTLPSDLPVFLIGPPTSSHPDGLYPATITAHRVTIADLAGRDGGWLIHGKGAWEGTLYTTNTGLADFTESWELTKIGP